FYSRGTESWGEASPAECSQAPASCSASLPSPREGQGCPGKEIRLQRSTAPLALIVLAGFVPAIHAFPARLQDVDTRHKAGQDDFNLASHAAKGPAFRPANTFPRQPCPRGVQRANARGGSRRFRCGSTGRCTAGHEPGIPLGHSLPKIAVKAC